MRRLWPFHPAANDRNTIKPNCIEPMNVVKRLRHNPVSTYVTVSQSSAYRHAGALIWVKRQDSGSLPWTVIGLSKNVGLIDINVILCPRAICGISQERRKQP